MKLSLGCHVRFFVRQWRMEIFKKVIDSLFQQKSKMIRSGYDDDVTMFSTLVIPAKIMPTALPEVWWPTGSGSWSPSSASPSSTWRSTPGSRGCQDLRTECSWTRQIKSNLAITNLFWREIISQKLIIHSPLIDDLTRCKLYDPQTFKIAAFMKMESYF